MDFKPSAMLIALLIAGIGLIAIYGFIGGIKGYYGVEVDDSYKTSYDKMGRISENITSKGKADIESKLEKEDIGYFRALDLIWKAIKLPFEIISITGEIVTSLIIDLRLPSWVNWGVAFGTIMTIAVVFYIISAMLKWKS